ncbi:hypothetical protein [Nonomuraea cavernae]|nr:hypothetical protein [Nonomuraea cavernae]
MARLTSAALLATALSALPASASAETNGYTPEQVCGSGFGRVAGGTQPVTDHLGIVRGHVHLLHSVRTDQYCVVTIKSSFVGQLTPTRAALVRRGFFRSHSTFPDEGNFRYYAGPVKVQVKGGCFAFDGRIDNVPDNRRMAGVQIRAYGGSKGFDHCGGHREARRGSS